jgi:uncharacterized metal-binding protein
MSDCSCTCSSGPLLVLPCAGGSTVGQISNAVAVKMDKQGKATIYCLIGVAAQIPGMVDAAKSASAVIAFDGCLVPCAKAASAVIAFDGCPVPCTKSASSVIAFDGCPVPCAKSASSVIACNGCPVPCAKAALDHIGIPISQHIVVTDPGIDIMHVFEWSGEQIEKGIDSVTVTLSMNK